MYVQAVCTRLFFKEPEYKAKENPALHKAGLSYQWWFTLNSVSNYYNQEEAVDRDTTLESMKTEHQE